MRYHRLICLLFICLVFQIVLTMGWWDNQWHYRIPIKITATRDVAYYPFFSQINLGYTLHNGSLDNSSVVIIKGDIYFPYRLEFDSDNKISLSFVADEITENSASVYYIYYDSDIFPRKNIYQTLYRKGIYPFNDDIEVYERDIDNDDIDDIIVKNSFFELIISGRNGKIINYRRRGSSRKYMVDFYVRDEDCITYDPNDAVRKSRGVTLTQEGLDIEVESEVISADYMKGRSLRYRIKYFIRPNYPDIEIHMEIINIADIPHTFSDCKYGNIYIPLIVSEITDKERFMDDNNIDGFPFYPEALNYISVGTDFYFFIINKNINFLNYIDNRIIVGIPSLILYPSDGEKTYIVISASIEKSPEAILNIYNNSVELEIMDFEYFYYCGDGICDESECITNCSDCKRGGFPALCAGDGYCNIFIGENCSVSEDCQCDNARFCLVGTEYSDPRGCVLKGIKFKDGEHCPASEMCESKNCVNNICCEQNHTCCGVDDDCGSRRFCDKHVFYCVDKYEDGSRCDRDSQCVSGNCRNGICCETGRLCCHTDDDCGYGICLEDKFICNILLPDIKANKRLTRKVIREGDTVDVLYTVINNGKGAAINVEISDELPRRFMLVNNQSIYMIRGLLEPGDSVTLRYTIKALEYGNYTVPVTKIRYYDMEGAYYTAKPQLLTEKITVLRGPTPTPLPSIIIGPVRATPPPTATPAISVTSRVATVSPALSPTVNAILEYNNTANEITADNSSELDHENNPSLNLTEVDSQEIELHKNDNKTAANTGNTKYIILLMFLVSVVIYIYRRKKGSVCLREATQEIKISGDLAVGDTEVGGDTDTVEEELNFF